jgi:PTS system nitrogen regulatory IIA component
MSTVRWHLCECNVFNALRLGRRGLAAAVPAGHQEPILQPDDEKLPERHMMITDLVAPEAILPALKVISKKQALQELAARAAVLTGQNERAVFEVLLQREKLGTTAVGYGVAIPHGKLPKLERLFGMFARLERPIDFEAMDGQPVDLVFLLLAPEGAGADHLKALARIARLLRDQDVAKKLRASRDAQAIYSVLALPPATAA